MSPALVRRQAGLAAVALLAALGAIALGRADGEAATPIEPPPAGADPWKDGIAGLIPASDYGRESACGIVLTEELHGVAHPVLPCGVDLVLAYEGHEVRAEVIARGPQGGPPREFDLTQALADDLGVTRDFTDEGTQTIRWRFAAPG